MAGKLSSATRGPAGTPAVLTIAGSDSGGGAGIQADLKAFARCGVHGMSAITAITAQSTIGVTAIHEVPPEIVLAQVRAVVADIGVDAVKVGMLGTAQVTRAVALALDELPAGTPVVVDPVMVAESGARLLDSDAERALIEKIVPRATVLTPNLPEARALTGVEAADGEAEGLARAVLALGTSTVVLTGGHRAQAVDLFLDSDGQARRDSRRALPGRRRPRVWLHALLGARRPTRAGRYSPAGGPRSPDPCGPSCGARVARTRRRRGPGRRPWSRLSARERARLRPAPRPGRPARGIIEWL